MGLFSFLNKNKQDTTAEDSGYYSRDEDSAATRARSKRASSAGEPAATGRGKKSREADDPVLPEKKRARRRLVGAIALALAVAVGLPMLLDSEPKPLASDIAIQIPSREKAAPLPVPAAPAVSAAESLDKREQIVEPPKAEPTDVKTVSLNSAEPKPEPKAAVLKPEPKPEPKPVKAEPKPEPKQVAKAEPKPAEPKHAKPEEATRALDILEGKAPEAGEKYVVQVAALGSAEKVAELQGKLKAAGIRSFTHKVTTASGERIQVKVGPFSKEEADKTRAKLDKVGLAGSIVKPDGK
ncbi:MAG TPA: SPOR domain-containing protein [Telluria sp.]|nr:SPOR domain-containing protein [Telluria sp.]